jgi:hypothetical protein
MMQGLNKSAAALPDAIEVERGRWPRPSPPIGLADESSPGAPSPARALQQRLIDDLNDAAIEDDGRRWAPGVTLLVCAGVSMGLWLTIGGVIYALHWSGI